MTAEGAVFMCSWTASGTDRHWAFVELLTEIYETISCKHVLLTCGKCFIKSCLCWASLCVRRSPAGMIEGTPQLHANAWKVSSACVAPVNLPIMDPCEMNQHNGNYSTFSGYDKRLYMNHINSFARAHVYVPVFYASQCDVLLGSVFAPCHGYISPNLYQQQCRYQACRCGSSCLCTALAHYTYLCSKHQVHIDFRSHVSECGELLFS